MQPRKKVKTNANDIKPLITEEARLSKREAKAANKPVKTDKADQPEQANTVDPQEEEKQIQIKTSQLQRNREIERDVYGYEVRKSKNWINKQRTLMFGSRGINAQGRFIMQDVFGLLPHAKKENKIEKIEINEQVEELCQLNSCTNALYMECRKKRDLYLWMAKFPTGPSTKFHVENIHTTEELRMTGNCLKGSRPLLSFDAAFDETPHFKLLKEVLVQTFGTPNMHPKSKPFYDHMFAFNVADNRIWFRNYQIVYNKEEKDISDIELIEIGPRFVLNPIKTFEGCMSGEVLYSNEFYVTPNKVRRDAKLKKFLEKAKKVGKKQKKRDEMRNLTHEQDEVDRIFDEDDDDFEDVEDDE